MRGTANKPFYLLIAFMLSGLVMLWQFGVVAFFFTHFGNPLTLSISSVIIGAFLIAFCWGGYVRVHEVSTSEIAMRLVNNLTQSNTPPEKRVLMIDELLEFTFPASCRDSAVARTVSALAERVRTSGTNGGKKLNDKDALSELFENKLDSGAGFLNATCAFILMLALLCTALGLTHAFIEYALKVGNTEVAAEETRKGLLLTLQGIGIAYVTSVFGFGSLLLLKLLEMLVDRRAEAVSEQFEERMFAFINPVIESEQFAQLLHLETTLSVRELAKEKEDA